MGQDDPGHLKIASVVAKDLAFLQRRDTAEGSHGSKVLHRQLKIGREST